MYARAPIIGNICTIMDKISETNFSSHVKLRTTGKVHFFVFHKRLASIDKIFILRGRLGTRL